MEILRLVVVLCALHQAKPLDSEVSPIEHELRINKRQGDIVTLIPDGVSSGPVEPRVNCTARYPCVAIDADLVTWTLLGVGSQTLPALPGRSVEVEEFGNILVATLVLDPVSVDHSDFYVCQIQGGSTPAVNIIVNVTDEPLELEANTPVSDISSATEGTILTILCTTTTCLEGVSVEFYREGPPHELVFQTFSTDSNQSFAYNHVINSNSAGNYFCQAVHTDVNTNVTIRSSMRFFTIQGMPMKATQAPMDGSSGTTQPPTGGSSTGAGSTTSDVPMDGTVATQAAGIPTPLFQSALSLTLLLVTLTALLMS